MGGLILKDLFSLKSYWKTLGLLGVIVLVLGFSSKELSFGGFIIVMFSIMAISSFSYDNIVKWDMFALSLPVKRSQIVASKYILCILFGFVGFVFVTAIDFVLVPLLKAPIAEFLLSNGLLFCVGVLINMLMLPFVYKFGVEKARIILMVLCLSPLLLTTLLPLLQVSEQGMEQALLGLVKLWWLLPVAVAAVGVVSYWISCGIYQKKEIE